MKKFLYLLFLVISVISFTSCSSSKDDSTDSSSKLVGKWKAYRYVDCYDLVTFNNDGSGNFFYWEGDECDGPDEFIYSYDDNTGFLVFHFIDCDDEWTLSWINDNSFYADGYQWTRQ